MKTNLKLMLVLVLNIVSNRVLTVSMLQNLIRKLKQLYAASHATVSRCPLFRCEANLLLDVCLKVYL